MRADVAVIGAGVVGLFAAWELARRGLAVAVVEAERAPGLGVTSRQANVVHVIQPPPWSLRWRLCLEGNRLYHEMVAGELGVRLRRTQLLLVATTRAGVARALALLPALRALLPRRHWPQLLSGRELRSVEPSLSESVRAGLRVPGYAVVDWRELVSRLARALDEAGAEQLYGSRVVGARASRDGVELETSSGITLRARAVVNAAGLYSDRVAAMLGDPRYRIVPRKGVIAVYPGRLAESIVAAVEAPRGRETKGGAVVPQLDGTTFVGPTLSPAAGREDYSYSPRDLEVLRSRFQPLLAEPLGRPSRVVVGIRPSTPRGDFIIEVGRRAPAVHLVGIESPGLTAAPAIAVRVAGAVERLLRGSRPL